MATPSLYALLIDASGLSNAEAAGVHSVNLRTVERWVSGKATAPAGVLIELAELIGKQSETMAQALAIIDEQDAGNPGAEDAVVLGLARSNAEAQTLGWPTRSAQARMIGALAAHILLDERSVEITDRGEFEVPSAALKTGGH